MFVVSVVISSLTAQVRQQARDACQREARTAALYALSRELAVSRDRGPILQAARNHIAGLLDAKIAFLLADPLQSAATLEVALTDFALTPELTALAQWVQIHHRPAGLGTDTGNQARALFLPLHTATRSLGVIGVLPSDPQRVEGLAQRQLLETFSQQLATSLEGLQLVAQAHRAQLQVERQELRNSLLSSVSHDLRTPLAAITGSATTLLDTPAQDAPLHKELLETIRDEADRLNRLVGNLLDMTRLESGGVEPRKDWIPLEEVVGSALDRAQKLLQAHVVEVSLPADLPLVPMDAVLCEQMLLNLLDNAAKYTPPGTRVHLRAWAEPGQVVLLVADEGPGLPSGSEHLVFEKFFRGRADNTRGSGLGLAIAHGIVTAHGGQLTAGASPSGGAQFRITLPVAGEPPQLPMEVNE